MAAGKYTFTIEQGATTDFEIVWTDSAGSAIDLANYEAAMIIRTDYGGSEIQALTSSIGDTYTKASGSAFLSLSGSGLTTPLTSGSIGVYIGHELTDSFTFTEAVYDIELTKDQARTRILQGKVKLSKDVT
jgi:hypothetical protein